MVGVFGVKRRNINLLSEMSKTYVGPKLEIILQGGVDCDSSELPKCVPSLLAPRRAGSLGSLPEAGCWGSFGFAAIEKSSRSIILSTGLNVAMFPSLEGTGA